MATSLQSPRVSCQASASPPAHPGAFALRPLAIWHLASLDAPTVAIVWAFAVARSAHVHLELWIALLLASGTWTVYVLDRVLDTGRAIRMHTPEVLRDRHLFHWQHRSTFIPLATCTGAAATAMIIKLMSPAAREHDSVIAAAALAYFSGVHAKARFPLWLHSICSKEMIVGILFAAGCAAPTLTRLNHADSIGPLLLSFACLAGLAWLNCAAISSWESHAESRTFPLSAGLFSFTCLAIAALIAPQFAAGSVLLLCAALSSLLLLGLHASRRRYSPLVLRALADFVLLVPAFVLMPGIRSA